MAIQNRRGKKINFDANKMLPGELAVSDDSKEIFVAFAPGDVKKMATYEDMENNIRDATADIAADLTTQVNTATNNANTAANSANASATNANNAASTASTAAQQAQSIVESASPIINTNLQATYANKATGMTGTSIKCPVSDDSVAIVQKVEGLSTQVTSTQGKNLFDSGKVNSFTLSNGVTVTNSGGKIYLNGTANSDVDVYIFGTDTSGYSFNTEENKLRIKMKELAIPLTLSNNLELPNYFCDESINYYETTIPSSSNARSAFVRINTNKVFNNTELKIQLEQGLVATSIESFVPDSPSPDYPSPIKSSGDETGSIDIISGSKNLFDSSKVNSITLGNNVTITNNNGKIYLNGTATDYCDLYVCGPDSAALFFNSEAITLRSKVRALSGSLTLSNNLGLPNYFCDENISYYESTIPTGSNIHSAFVRINAGTVFNNAELKIQLEQDSIATAHEPYKSSKYTINSIMRSLPNGVKDTVEKINGSWYLVKRVGKLILNGSESWAAYQDTQVNVLGFYIPVSGHKATSAIIDKFSYTTTDIASGGNLSVNYQVMTITFEFIKLAINKILAGNLSTFKTWLASNNITVLYELATPSYTQLTDLILTSYQGVTNILTCCTTPPTLTVDFMSKLWGDMYLKDLGLADLQKSKIDKTSIVQTDTVNDSTKVVSATVAYLLGIEIDSLYSELGFVDSAAHSTFTAYPRDNLDGKSNGFTVKYMEVGDVASATYSPQPGTYPRWWNVLTFGMYARVVQIACQAYKGVDTSDCKVYIRSQHDAGVTGWKLLLNNEMISNTDQVNDSSKVASAAVVYQHGQEIDALNAFSVMDVAPYLNGYTKYDSYGYGVLLTKVGKVVTVYIALNTQSATNLNAYTQIATLPSGYRPWAQTLIICAASDGAFKHLIINSDGILTVGHQSISSLSWIIGSVSYVVS